MAMESWNYDPVHSSVTFSVRHLMVSKVRGRFKKWTGTLAFDEQDPAQSKAEIEIDAASVDTENEQRDAHLRSADFLEADKFPTIEFTGKVVERVGDQLKVHGDLTIRDATRPVVLDVEYAGRVKDPWGGERVGFSAHTSVSRKDFGLVWNILLEAGGVTVGDKIDINIEVEATKAA